MINIFFIMAFKFFPTYLCCRCFFTFCTHHLSSSLYVFFLLPFLLHMSFTRLLFSFRVYFISFCLVDRCAISLWCFIRRKLHALLIRNKIVRILAESSVGMISFSLKGFLLYDQVTFRQHRCIKFHMKYVVANSGNKYSDWQLIISSLLLLYHFSRLKIYEGQT